MQKPRDPFGQAVCTIRRDLRVGRYVRGERLSIADLASELDLSATPVREALARLAGEGLIEERRGQGYFSWRLDVVDLLELYDLQVLYLRAGLEGARWVPGRLANSDGGLDEVEAIFEEIVRWSGSAALSGANRLLADRLAAPRRAEMEVLVDGPAELDCLLAASDISAALEWLEGYHARRAAAGPAIISALRGLADIVSL